MVRLNPENLERLEPRHFKRRDDAVRPGKHYLDVGRVGKHRDDDGRVTRDVGRRAARLRTSDHQLVHRAAATRVDRDAGQWPETARVGQIEYRTSISGTPAKRPTSRCTAHSNQKCLAISQSDNETFKILPSYNPAILQFLRSHPAILPSCNSRRSSSERQPLPSALRCLPCREIVPPLRGRGRETRTSESY